MGFVLSRMFYFDYDGTFSRVSLFLHHMMSVAVIVKPRHMLIGF